jgi:phosphatidylserine decarboxylase
MSQPPRRPVPLLGEIFVGPRAAEVLTSELTRHLGPKKGLLLAVTADSPVLANALAALLPGDTLTVVPLAGAAEQLREHLAAAGPWVGQRVRVVDALADVEPVDVAVLAEVLSGDAESARGYLDEVGKHVAEGGVLSVAVPAAFDGAAEELGRQADFYGVGSDLVLRNTPPLRIHRLRFTPAATPVADRLLPALRPSSVPLAGRMHIDSNGVAAAGIALGLAAALRLRGRRRLRSRPQEAPTGRRRLRSRPQEAPTGRRRLWLVPALAALPVAAFFRDPERDAPEDESAVVAASDGRVLAVERLTDPRFGQPDGYLRIAVFLSVLDVHVNRAPVAGRVVEYVVEDGGYAPAMRAAAEHNVAAYTVLDTERGRVVVAQRTGLLARRIVQRAPAGALLARGERFGLIRFGSRTDVYLPADAADPVVGPGDRVFGGTTVIARWRD